MNISAERIPTIYCKLKKFYYMPKERIHNFEISSKRIQQAYRYIIIQGCYVLI